MKYKDEVKKTELTEIPETPPELSDEDDVEIGDTANVHVQHAVTLKCIRCTQDVKYERSLECINELHMLRQFKVENRLPHQA